MGLCICVYIFHWPSNKTCLKLDGQLNVWRWSLWEGCGWRPHDMSIRQCTSLHGGGLISKLPRPVIILINEQLFSLGSRICILILNLAVLAPRRLSPPLSHVSSSCSHASSLTNLGPVARLDCGEGQTHPHCCPKILESAVILFLEQAAPWCAWGDLQANSRS